jgi:predicted transcriptional regulator
MVVAYQDAKGRGHYMAAQVSRKPQNPIEVTKLRPKIPDWVDPGKFARLEGFVE